jgi:crotonobetainyl-CoA:carnitine CoA-transferase CaiB-like acyl-CoA transferase
MCNKEKFWGVLCGKIGRPEYAEDPRFLRFADRLKNRALVQEVLDEALQEKTTAEWMEVFAGFVPAAPLMNVQEAIENPFAEERGRMETVRHQSGKEFRLLTTPITLTGDEPEENRPGPELGDSTEDLLSEIGIGGDDLAALRERGIV